MGRQVIILIAVPIVTIIVAVFFIFNSSANAPSDYVEVTDFDSCVAAGNPVLESLPEQCRTEDGTTYVRDVEGIPAN